MSTATHGGTAPTAGPGTTTGPKKKLRTRVDDIIKKIPAVYAPHYTVPPTRHKDGYWWCQINVRHTCD